MNFKLGTEMITLYDAPSSGNGHKVELILNLLGHEFERREIHILQGESRTKEFMATLNAAGKIPVVVLDDGRTLTESNAILHFFGEGTPYVPEDPFYRAQMLSWMFWEQYSHEPTVAVVRSWRKYKRMTPEQEAQLDEKVAGGYEVLDLMERHLAENAWLVGDRASLADLALYPYTAKATEGGFDLSQYTAIQAWLARVEALEGFKPMTQSEPQNQERQN